MILIIMVASMIALFFCMMYLPFCLSEDKIKEGWRWYFIYGIPQVFYKEWYAENKIWVRNLLVVSLLILALSFFYLLVFGVPTN